MYAGTLCWAWKMAQEIGVLQAELIQRAKDNAMITVASMIEQQIQEAVHTALADSRIKIGTLTRQLEEANCARAKAEWAIKRVFDRNLNIHVSPHELLSNTLDINRFAKLMGEKAAHEFLHVSGLAFEKHAEFHELKYSAQYSSRNFDPSFRPILDQPFAVDPKHWPHP